MAIARAPDRASRAGTRRRSSGASRAFFLGLTAGAVYFAATLYWVAGVMVTYGGLARPVGVVLNAALVAFLALFPAAFAALAWRLIDRLGSAGLMLTPAVWVATELGRRHLFGGFPWVLLGYSQVTVLPIAQLASLLGVYGVSGLVALVNAASVCLVLGRGRVRIVAAALAAGLVALTALWGQARVANGGLTRAGVPLRVGMVQGNIPQDQKWDPAFARAILDGYLHKTREAAARGAEFIIWPESSTPFFFEEDRAGAAEIRELARATGADLLIGSDQIERGRPPKYYNSAYLVTPDGRTAGTYRKIHLVPFGEYVPFRQVLFFAAPLVESVSDFTAGTDPVMLPLGRGLVSTAICYEIVYPDLIRRFVLAGSELLTTITNDAWYGRSSAPYQHFWQAAMRSIEQGRYLARAANTGISGIVDPYGRALMQSALFEPAVLVGDVRLLDGRTLYGRTGDLFAYLCAGLTLAALIAVGRPSRIR